MNIINQLKVVIQSHNNLNGYGSGGYSSADSKGYESPGERSGGQLPIEMVSKILDSTQSYELLGMLISEIYRNYDKIGNLKPKEEDFYMFHLHFVKKLSARLQINRSATKYTKLEKYLKNILENYVCDKLIN